MVIGFFVVALVAGQFAEVVLEGGDGPAGTQRFLVADAFLVQAAGFFAVAGPEFDVSHVEKDYHFGGFVTSQAEKPKAFFESGAGPGDVAHVEAS